MSKRPLAEPKWWKNTFFWFAGLLLVVGIVGLIGGEALIRDPGQVDENYLVWFYLAAAALMFINGWLTHRQAVRHYEEQRNLDS